MKAPSSRILGYGRRPLAIYFFAFVACCFLAGCASAPKETQGSDGVTYKGTKNFDNVWIAEGFDFSGYTTMLVAPISSEVKPETAKERSRLETSQQMILKYLAHSIKTNRIVATVVSKQTAVELTGKCLKLDNTITEFTDGSTAARVTVGFGAGTPFLRLRGQIVDMTTGKPLLTYDLDERAGLVMGHMTSTELLLEAAALELVKDITELLVHVAKRQPIKYR